MLIQGQRKLNGTADASSFAALVHARCTPRRLLTGFAAVATANIATSSSSIRIVRDTRYSGTLGCANLKVSQVPEVARAAEKRTAPFRGGQEKEDKALRVCTCCLYVRKRGREGSKGKKNGVGEEERVEAAAC